MKKRFGNSVVTFIMLFVLMTIVTIGMGYYKKATAMERASFQISFPVQNEVSSVAVNIGDQGLPKKIIQPGKITLSSGHRGGIVNEGKDDLWIKVEATGFPGGVKLKSTDPSFNKNTGVFTRPLKPNKAFSLDIETNIPDELINEAKICDAKITFINAKDGSMLGSIPVTISNSNEECEECNSDNNKNGECHEKE